MPVIISCPNCSRRFWSDKKRCPDCGWDPNAKTGDTDLPPDVPAESDDTAAEKEEAEESETAEASMEMVPGPKFTSLEELNVGQLRPMARDLGVEHWYRLGKGKLITAIKAAQKKAKQPHDA